ncbi:MAG: transporter substrate-binding domain-containing protein [Bacteroidaceae bacterium]|nr:transporter substrate-binding domain-containing protein [Bacteroidaceae bacterium]
MKNRIRSIILYFGVILILMPQQTNADNQKNVQQQHIINAAIFNDIPPYHFKDKDGKTIGYCVDVFKEIMKRLNYNYRIVSDSYINRDLKSEKIDMIIDIPYIGITDSLYTLSETYTNAPICLLYSKKMRKNKHISDPFKCIAVPQDSMLIKILKQSGIKTDKIYYCPTKTAFHLIEEKKCDAIFDYHERILYTINALNIDESSFSRTNHHVNEISLAFAFNKGDSSLVYKVNDVLYQMKYDLTLSKIENKWFAPSHLSVSNKSLKRQFNFNLIIILIFIFIIFIFIYIILITPQKDKIQTKFLSDIFTNQPNPICSFEKDKDGSNIHITYQNKACIDFLENLKRNLTAEEFQKNWNEEKLQLKKIEGKKGKSTEHKIISFKHQPDMEILIIRSPIKKNQIITIYIDITELMEIQRKTERSHRLKMAFLANMSYSLHTPLNSIIGFSSLLSESKLSKAEIKEYTEIIVYNNKLLLKLVDEIIDLSFIESGDLKIKLAWTDLNYILKDTQTIFQKMLKDNEKDKDIKLLIDMPYIEFKANIDVNRIKQILTIFLTNAVKHTKNGVIRFGAFEYKGNLLLYVQDTGNGISAEQLPTIFNRFEKINDITKSTGLGLTICQAILKGMKGWADATSQEGKGSVFWACAPIEIKYKKNENYLWHDINELLTNNFPESRK